MSEICPTVKVKSDHPEHKGHVVVNASDFDEKVHELHPDSVAILPPPPVGLPSPDKVEK